MAKSPRSGSFAAAPATRPSSVEQRLGVAEMLIRGAKHAQEKHFPAAIREFTNAIKQDPNNAIAYKLRAIAKVQRAESIWEKITEEDIRLNLKGKERNRAFSLQTSAVADLQRALELNPKDIDAHKLKIRIIMEGGQKVITESELCRA